MGWKRKKNQKYIKMQEKKCLEKLNLKHQKSEIYKKLFKVENGGIKKQKLMGWKTKMFKNVVKNPF